MLTEHTQIRSICALWWRHMKTCAHVYVSIRQHELAGTITNRVSITCRVGPYHATFFSTPPTTYLAMTMRTVTHPPRLCPPTSGMRSAGGASAAEAYVGIRQHTSAHVSTRQHTSAHVSIRRHSSVFVSVRQHTWRRRRKCRRGFERRPPCSSPLTNVCVGLGGGRVG